MPRKAMPWKAVLLSMLAGIGTAAAAPIPQAQPLQAMALPDPVRQALAARMQREALSDSARVQRILDFMVADDGLALRYQEQPTHGIARSVELRRVNCLSFTLLFVALARASGLEARAQATDAAMAVRVLDGTVYRTSHVNAGVQIDRRWHSVDVAWQGLVAGRPPEPISDLQAVALLHNNNAVEQLMLGQQGPAAEESAVALALDPGNATIWSNAGVVRWRAAQRTAAEQAYQQALRLQRDHVGALGNLAGLYRSVGNTRLAAIYARRLQRAQARDPFSQFLIGQGMAASGLYDAAAVHFRRAIRLMPDQPEFHRDLADAYAKQGKRGAAERARARASALETRRAAQRWLRMVDDPDPG